MQEMQEAQVWSLGWEDPLEKEMAIHSSILALKIPWREEPDGLQSIGSQKVRHIHIIILSCLIAFLWFCIFSLVLSNVFFGTWGRPRRLSFFYKQEAGRGHGNISLCHVKIQEHSYSQIRKRALTRQWICWQRDLGLPSLQNCER